jgi:thiamine kinase-like enzyme
MKINSAVRQASDPNEFAARVRAIEQVLADGGISLRSAELLHHKLNAIVKAEFNSVPICIKLYYQGGRTSLRRVTPLAQELNALIALGRRDIPVPQIVEINQDPIFGSQDYLGYLYRYVDSAPMDSEQRQALHGLTASLAKLHTFDRASLDLGRFSMLQQSIRDSRKAIDRYFPREKTMAEPWAADVLDRWEREIARGLPILEAISPSELELSVVHGRIKPEHVQVVADSQIQIIDWETICISERALELAYVLSRFCLMRDSSLLEQDLLKSIVAEYLKTSPLNKTERGIINSVFRWGCYWTLFTRYHEHRRACVHCHHNDLFTQQTQWLEDYRYDLL